MYGVTARQERESDGVAYGGSGDPRRSIELLWGVPPRRKRGPKPRLSVADIRQAGVALADAEGLAALSMRRVAAELGVSAMALYTYVPSKAELIDLMLDGVYAELPTGDVPGEGWRDRLATLARENRALLEWHPWLLSIAMSRPVMGPGVIAKYDRELRAIDGIGLDDIEMDSVLTLLIGYVQSAVREGLAAAGAERSTGMSDEQWWAAYQPAFDAVLDPAGYPVAVRVGSAAGAAQGGAYHPGRAFEFGLARVLDGVAALIQRRR
ncbi:MAG: TetR family transcriptional regulator [Actinophytocola sp.]|nr:TetR family transcriptional regulator [Actinophytocola sp.]